MFQSIILFTRKFSYNLFTFLIRRRYLQFYYKKNVLIQFIYKKMIFKIFIQKTDFFFYNFICKMYKKLLPFNFVHKKITFIIFIYKKMILIYFLLKNLTTCNFTSIKLFEFIYFFRKWFLLSFITKMILQFYLRKYFNQQHDFYLLLQNDFNFFLFFQLKEIISVLLKKQFQILC